MTPTPRPWQPAFLEALLKPASLPAVVPPPLPPAAPVRRLAPGVKDILGEETLRAFARQIG